MIYPSSYRGKKEKSLSDFILCLKRKYKNGLLSESIIKILESIPEWSWKIQKNGVRIIISYEEAKTILKKYNFKNLREYRKNKPKELPFNPKLTFKKEWIDWNDYLGKRGIYDWISYKEAVKISSNLGLKNNREWREYRKKNKLIGIPIKPDQAYRNKGWKNWGEWLGNENILIGANK